MHLKYVASAVASWPVEMHMKAILALAILDSSCRIAYKGYMGIQWNNKHLLKCIRFFLGKCTPNIMHTNAYED